MICDECGVELQTGDWPFCPHGVSALAVVPDDVPGGFVVENGFETPRRFDSRSAHRKALDAEGLQMRVDNRGPLDKICPRWDTVDLDAAAALVSRGAQARAARKILEPAVITVRDGDPFRAGDLDG